MRSLIPEETRSQTRSHLIVAGFCIVLTAFFYYIGYIWGLFSDIIEAAAPFLIGFGFAFLLRPVVNRIEWLLSKSIFRIKPFPRLTRLLASLLAVLLLLAIIIGFLSVLVPQLISSVTSLVDTIIAFVNENAPTASAWLVEHGVLSSTSQGNELVNAIKENLGTLVGFSSGVVSYAVSISSSVYTVVFRMFLGLIAAFYILMDKELFSTQIKKICYATMTRPHCETLIYWTRRAGRIFSGFITGKILDSLIIGVLCYLFMLLFGIEYALLISIIVGVTNIIPFFGPFIGAIPSILILLMVNPASALWFGIFIIILQQVDGNIIGPYILGDQVGVSAFWIMVAIVIGSRLFGFIGMLLSVPIFALVYAIIHTVIDVRLKKRGLPTKTSDYIKAPEILEETHEEKAD